MNPRDINVRFFACAIFVSLAALASGAHASISTTIEPVRPLMDQRFDAKISGVPAHHRILITTDTLAQDGLHWRSKAIFAADLNGMVDLNRQAPISGSYRGIDEMGLIWSAMPGDGPANANRAFFSVSDFSRPIMTTLEVRDGDTVIARTTIERRYTNPLVRRRSMAVGLGELFAPNDGQSHPGVLVIGGSDPGIGSPDIAMLLASHGFAALAVGYFGAPGLPATLQGVPMETFARAIDWMRKQAEVDPRFIALYGESRGTEPALWTAAHADIVKAVVVRSPSFALWGGITQNHLPGSAAWTWQGKALPYIPNRITATFALHYIWHWVMGTPADQSELFKQDLDGFGGTDAVEIPVERIKGPILMLAGKDDHIWPSYPMAQHIVQRLGRFHHPYLDALLAYDDVGHPIPYAYIPTGGARQRLRFGVGGTPQGAARAQMDAWPRVLSFLANGASSDLRALGRPARDH